MSETQFLEAYNSAGYLLNHWVFSLLVIGSFIVFLFSIGLSLYRDSMNNERSILFAMSLLTLVFSSIIYVFYVVYASEEVIDRYTKTLEYQHVTVDSINYGEYVRFTYTDRDGNKVDEKVHKSVVTYIRDLKKGEPVRVDFKEINIKTIKADEAPNGLYDVKVHVPNDFKE